MQFSIVAATLALALGVAAQPQHGGHAHHGASMNVHQAKTQCGGDEMACCISKSEIKSDGIASGLLARGLLNSVLGSSDQACAKWSLIENANVLGFTKQGQNGNSCSQTTACCPKGEESCNSL